MSQLELLFQNTLQTSRGYWLQGGTAHQEMNRKEYFWTVYNLLQDGLQRKGGISARQKKKVDENKNKKTTVDINSCPVSMFVQTTISAASPIFSLNPVSKHLPFGWPLSFEWVHRTTASLHPSGYLVHYVLVLSMTRNQASHLHRQDIRHLKLNITSALFFIFVLKGQYQYVMILCVQSYFSSHMLLQIIVWIFVFLF